MARAAQTLQQMAATLQMEGVPPAEWNAGNKLLLDHLLALDPKIKLEIANSLWTQADAKIKPDFISDCQKSYRAEVAAVDFKKPATAEKINDWVSQSTHGKITSLFDPPLSAGPAPHPGGCDLFQGELGEAVRPEADARLALHPPGRTNGAASANEPQGKDELF